jgi:hypothetical protein
MPLARLDSDMNGFVDVRTEMLFEEVGADLLRIRSSKGIHYVPSRLVWISISKGNPVSD